jgi:hypothetical protein
MIIACTALRRLAVANAPQKLAKLEKLTSKYKPRLKVRKRISEHKKSSIKIEIIRRWPELIHKTVIFIFQLSDATGCNRLQQRVEDVVWEIIVRTWTNLMVLPLKFDNAPL